MQWLPGARVAPPGAPRKGQSHGTTGRLFAARARLQIDFSQKLDTKIADLQQKWLYGPYSRTILLVDSTRDVE